MHEIKRKAMLYLAGALLLSAVTGYLTWQRIQSFELQFGENVQVVVAKQSVSAKTPLVSSMFETIELPEKFAFPSMLHSIRETEGSLSLVPLQKGDVVTRPMLKQLQDIDERMRIVNLSQSERVVFDEPLDVTDSVDIVVSYQEGEKPVTKILLQDVPVGRVWQEKERQRAIGIELSLEDAQQLIFMQNFSQQIRVLKHPVTTVVR